MPYEHNLPVVINPSGDIVVPLYIPHDADYTALLLGVLITLEEVERYERDPDYDDTSAQIVAGNWRDRTITPLIDAIANGTGMRVWKPQVIDIGTNKTTTSLVPVAVADTGFNHIFTFKNAIIRCHNIVISNSAVNVTNAQIDISGESPEAYAIASNEGTNGRPFTTIARFADLPLGVSKQIRLMMFVSGGTGTMNANSKLVWEIEEYA